MAHLLVCFTHNTTLAWRMVELWTAIGLSGITVLKGLAYACTPQVFLQEDAPLMPSLSNIFQRCSVNQSLLLGLAGESVLLERAFRESSKILQERKKSDDGVLFTFPVSQVYEVKRERN